MMSNLLISVPDPWGPKFEGHSGAATRTRTGPNEISFTAPVHMALVMLTAQPDREVALNTDHKSRFLAPAGTMEIVPASSELFARWSTHKENLLVGLAPERLQDLAGLEFENSTFELYPTSAGAVDERALVLAELMRAEFHDTECINELYMESLITVFSAYVLRNHSSLKNRQRRVHRGGLANKTWTLVTDYINSRFSEKLSIGELAAIAGLSPGHFLRAFKETANVSPHQYVLQLRLAHAERLILSTDLPLATVATHAGFASHSHLSSTMQRVWSTSPSILRQTNRPA